MLRGQIRLFRIKRTRISIRSILIFILFLSLALPDLNSTASVTLVYFQASAQDRRVLLEWETATEIDTVGFYVNRSINQSFGYTRVSSFIATTGDPLTGARYSFLDSGLTNGITYWYKLESIDTSQNSLLYDPPVSAVPAVTAANTPTPTVTSTSQAGSQSTATRTATKTQTPVTGGIQTATRTSSFTGSQATQTFNLTSSATAPLPQLSGTSISSTVPGSITDTLGMPISPTGTLVPMPAFELVFPTFTTTPTATLTPVPSLMDRIGRLSSGQVVMVGFVIFLWIILGGWFYYTLRRLE